jgi:hypothetical protein
MPASTACKQATEVSILVINASQHIVLSWKGCSDPCLSDATLSAFEYKMLPAAAGAVLEQIESI